MVVDDHPCPKCREQGHDSTGNHLMEFEDGNKYCNRCGYKEIKDEEPVRMDLELIKTFPITDLKERGISKSTAEHFRVRTSYSTNTGEANAYYFPLTKDGRLVAYKKRSLPKDFAIISDRSLKGVSIDMFGQAKSKQSGHKLLIVEGLEDCMAAYQMLYSDPKWPPSVVAIGSDAVKPVADNLSFINSFDEVLLCLDQDKAGQVAQAQIAKLIGDKVRIVRIPLKDPNEMLLKGKEKEFKDAFYSAKPYVPEGFITVQDVFEEATKMPEWGLSWPWPTLTELTYGIRPGEIIYFGAGVKIGKSSAVDAIIHHFHHHHKKLPAIFKFEEPVPMTVRKLAGKIANKQFHIPDADFDQSDLIDAVHRLEDKVIIYDNYGSTKWDVLQSAIRHAVVVWGCNPVIIDPLTRLVSGMDSAQANTELDRISDELSKMAIDLNFTPMVFCHLKAPVTGKTHEEGGEVRSAQFTGSRSMMGVCHYMIGLQRNKKAEDPIERNTTTFVLLEDRVFGKFGKFEVFFDSETGSYEEVIASTY